MPWWVPYLVLGAVLALGCFLVGGAMSVCLYAVREVSEASRRQQAFFTEHADRLQGLHAMKALMSSYPEQEPPSVDDPVEEMAKAQERAAKYKLDLSNPEDVSKYNRMVEQAMAAAGWPT